MYHATIKTEHSIVIEDFCHALWHIVSEGKSDNETKRPFRRIIVNLEQYWIENV